MSHPGFQLELLKRGAIDVHSLQDFQERLKSGTPLRVKCGFDPTRPDLHLGHAVVLNKLREFQDLGHTVVLVIGDFTAMIGDPTGKSEARPRLTRQEVATNAQTYLDQVFKILDPKQTEVHRNSTWLDDLKPVEIIELMSQMTVSRMLDRKDFAQRFDTGKPIYQHEFLYPLLQGYDSVVLNVDIEIGGTDQLFNLLVGRDIMPHYKKVPQVVMTMPLLEGTDARMVNSKIEGKKMSKSSNNYVGLTEDPIAMFRKIMQLDDHVIGRYFDLLSVSTSDWFPDAKVMKAFFAKEIITRFHSHEDAAEAERDFKLGYMHGNSVPTNIDELHLSSDSEGKLWLAKALSSTGLVKSTNEARRLLRAGSVRVDLNRVFDDQIHLEKGKTYIIRVGSKNRQFRRFTIT